MDGHVIHTDTCDWESVPPNLNACLKRSTSVRRTICGGSYSETVVDNVVRLSKCEILYLKTAPCAAPGGRYFAYFMSVPGTHLL